MQVGIHTTTFIRLLAFILVAVAYEGGKSIYGFFSPHRSVIIRCAGEMMVVVVEELYCEHKERDEREGRRSISEARA